MRLFLMKLSISSPPGIIVYITTEDVVTIESKKEDKDQESMQSSTTPDPEYHMGI